MSKPHILVTGGAGFIGSHLVEYLLGLGKRVVVIDDLSTGTRQNLHSCAHHPGFKLIVSRVSDCPELNELVAASESVYHLAAAVGVDLVVKSPIRTIQTNLQETEVILEAASHTRKPVLLTSSSEVYGKSTKAVFSEDDDLLIGPSTLGRWSYACSKLMDEFLALAYARERMTPVIIVRLFNIVGPRQVGSYGMVLPRFIQAAKSNQTLRVFGDGQQTRCFCYVNDAIKALTRLMDCPETRNQVFNVGSDEEISVLALAQLVIQQLKSSSSIQFVPYSEAYAPGFEDMTRRRPSLEKLARIIGFSPTTPLKTIIQKTAAG